MTSIRFFRDGSRNQTLYSALVRCPPSLTAHLTYDLFAAGIMSFYVSFVASLHRDFDKAAWLPPPHKVLPHKIDRFYTCFISLKFERLPREAPF